MLIAAFDLATQTGCAAGAPGKAPKLWTWDLRAEHRPMAMALLATHVRHYLATTKVTHVVYEEPMPITVALGVRTSEAALQTLRGSIGVLEACAHEAGAIVMSVGVQEARRHLVGGSIPKAQGKSLVFERCKVLGWKPMNYNESDAAAVWSYACGYLNPRLAHATTALFGRK